VNFLVDTLPIEQLDFRKRTGRKLALLPENLKWNIQLDQIVTRWLDLRANLTGSRTDNIYIVNPNWTSGDGAASWSAQPGKPRIER